MLGQLKNIQLQDINQQKSLENAVNIGIPTMKQEEWKYTYYNKILQHPFEINTEQHSGNKKFDLEAVPFIQDEKYKLIFIDGIFSADLSYFPQSQKFNFWNNNNVEESSSKVFLLELNNALVLDGLFIEITDGFSEEGNIGIYYISTTNNQIFNLKNKLKIGKNVQAKFSEYFINPNNLCTYYNVVTQINIDQDANIVWDKIQDGGEQYYLTDNTFVKQEKSSVFTINTITVSGNIVRNNLEIDVDGEYAENHMNGLYLLHGKDHCDNRTLVRHNQPNTNSNELYKGILADNSTGVFNGKIIVAQIAQKTNAFQSNRNLLLSNDANIYTKPQLEIFADDVKCSHGATSSQIEDSELFYLQARGIGKEMSRSLLTLAFAGEVLDKLSKNNKEFVEEKIFTTLGINI